MGEASATKFNNCHKLFHSVSPQLKANLPKCWNFNQLSIDYAIWPRLRSRLTRRGRTFRRKPWAFGGEDSHFSCTLLIPAFSLPSAPSNFTVELHCPWNAPLPPAKGGAPASALDLILDKSSALSSHLLAQASRLVSCYAFFKGWLLLSQPPSCLWKKTSFKT